ncbi:GNAT family N-acetyltransferase [Streptomyces sp. RFCAC02]|uniref:GNAT family N-acetyltransferase n=1 Tax=Streptomyces sp. RFCAC02 TaxID=2499143 RepID=UPI00101FEDFD|nr:GNAT family N-acetyltransferase [Streptomyces sp. RFCAC02]
MTIALRRVAEHEWDTVYEAVSWAFGGLFEPAAERAAWRGVTDLERAFALWDGDAVVGSFTSLPFRLSVPGGALVPTAGVSMVHVASTHRRQGLLRRMMRHGLDRAREAGEPLAVLTASEPAIYGRFGFGVAAYALQAEIDTARVGVRVPPGADDVRLSVTSPHEAAPRCEELYTRLVPTRPGMPARQPGWTEKILLDPPESRGGASATRCLLAERDGELLGYARYALRPRWTATVPDGTVIVRDLDAVEPAAYAAMLRFLTRIDLTSRVQLGMRPVDDPLVHLLTDVRRSELRTLDRLYARPVDVAAALAARTYAADVDVVLDVTDGFCGWNEGRWRLSGGPGGARCERTSDPADLALPAGALGAAYLGGTSLAALAAAGLVREVRAGALAAAATAFAWPVAPWLPHGF